MLLLVAVLYQPAWNGGVLWDDPAHITQPGLRSLSGLWRIWTELGATQQYYPLAHSAFWLQYQFWGETYLGYHLVNIALHASSAWLILLMLQRLHVRGALLAALIFAVHPVHVESVAWMSELKNTLSTTLYLCAALFYLRFDERRERRDYTAALVLFGATLLTKTVTASLPAALLIVFWWQRSTVRWRQDVVPLLPFFILGASAGLLTAYVERTFIGAQGSEFDLTLLERALLAGRAVWFYLGKLLWPARLSFVYPRWDIDQQQLWQYLPPLLLLALFLVLWLVRKRARAPLAALLLFSASLLPALGFVDVFPFRYSFVADHFQYLASIPVIALLAAGCALLLQHLKLNSTFARSAAAAVILLPMSFMTLRASRHYASAERLYTATLERNPDAWLAHNNLGLLLANQGRLGEARTHFMQAVRLNPRIAEHHMNMGRLLIAEGAIEEGSRYLREAIRIDPYAVDAYSNLGVALLRSGRLAEAQTVLEQALRIQPGHREATINLAVVRQEMAVRAGPRLR
ncbi:MAG TPA: tetratricopeptide repeat protein [Longimicrobiales bacterium]|nr:tetratricopeptide repeat protein [Longimicrobiales bacterium]